MRICYLIQSYKNPSQITRLVQTLRRASDALILVSHSVGSCQLEEALLQLPNVYVLYVEGSRGDFVTVQNYLNAIDWLLSNNFEFDWLVNLSGQDYPIRSLHQLEQTLQTTQYDGFMECFKVFSEESPWGITEGKTRYFYRYHKFDRNLSERKKSLLKPLKIVNYLQPFFRINFAYGLALGLRTATPFNKNFVCYGGAYYYTLSRKCIEYINQFMKQYPQILDYYRGVAVPEEGFIQTVLLNNPEFNLANDCKHYADFNRSQNGRPHLLVTEDYAMLENLPYYFARKFDAEVDSNILDLLDAKIQATSYAERLPSATD